MSGRLLLAYFQLAQSTRGHLQIKQLLTSPLNKENDYRG
jgi:hypothetical protein